MIPPVDEATAARIVAALSRARTRCISPVLALNQEGLLATEGYARLLRQHVLINTAEAVHSTRIKDLATAGLIPKDPTPAVTVKAIADQIRVLAEKARRGEFQ